ncbi:hypothetical protein BC827DRAFT_361009 [Russula dissimulans]|nr:hypothetical protein BC827DRAFT_361009 [Russula dissimulans]
MVEPLATIISVALPTTAAGYITLEDLLAIPVPPAFRQLPQLMPVEGDLRRLFAPRAMISSYDQSGKSRVNEWAYLSGRTRLSGTLGHGRHEWPSTFCHIPINM